VLIKIMVEEKNQIFSLPEGLKREPSVFILIPLLCGLYLAMPYS
jgi:hypothetical protein